MRGFTVRKMSCGDKIEDVTRRLYVSTSDGSKDQSIQTENSLKQYGL